MKRSNYTQRDGIGGRPAHRMRMRMRPAAQIIGAWLLSCACVATPRAAAADESVGHKLASEASAVGGQLRDATLASRIRAALVAECGLASDDIDVQVHGRVAELTGSVPDEPQHAAAIRVVRDVSGVSGVQDRLKVGRK
ncbi:TPA: BON domain-containing protein [Burkholderia vietnamiensis]|nr:BON domain-containing protein [Burkholderia vietnamiensis]